ncbi:MAG: Asp-tRNA(Asn)/Glu-tRNA(Gln) amidotransferase subunit GatC [Kiritimatiellales bacterium]|nr:Asp-tRNA(Asn)/Glu-tRNA(Gln) amidotransferase subunit GatC [Kiritimatiellales bacterium]
MALSPDDVRHIAKLARLNIEDSEVDKFTRELSSILDYVDQLKEVDTSNVEPSEQVTGLTNGFREDEVIEKDASPEELLETSPLPIIERQIETPSAHGDS